MLTIKQLKEKIQDLPDDMMVRLVDLSTDDISGLYDLSIGSLCVDDYVSEDDDSDEVKGQLLWICFFNTLNENPI